MNMQVQFDKREPPQNIVRRARKLDQWWLSIAECDLEAKLRTAFDAAKSAGHELDVMFTAKPG
jgi:hypothetical protein